MLPRSSAHLGNVPGAFAQVIGVVSRVLDRHHVGAVHLQHARRLLAEEGATIAAADSCAFSVEGASVEAQEVHQKDAQADL